MATSPGGFLEEVRQSSLNCISGGVLLSPPQIPMLKFQPSAPVCGERPFKEVTELK